MSEQKLNAVQGFDPSAYARDVYNEQGQCIGKTLDVKYRKLWFRMAYPNGKIEQVIRTLDAQVAVVEARVYANNTDAPESFLSNAFAQRNYDPTTEFGTAYLECAATVAVGRALADAGFGTQFCVEPEDNDTKPCDSPVQSPIVQAAPAQAQQQSKQTSTEQPPTSSSQNIQPAYNDQTPFDVMLKTMTYDEAVRIVIPNGKSKYAGKTLGMVACEDFGYVEWIADGYKRNNVMKAGAIIICQKHKGGNLNG